MDRLSLAFTERFLVSLVLAMIGFMAVQYGYKLFVSGVGLKKENGKLKFSGPTYMSLPTLSPDRVASTDTIIRGLALGDNTQLTTTDRAAVIDFAKTAREAVKLNPNAKVWIVTTPGTPDEISKRKAAISDVLTKAGFPESKIDKKVMDNAVQFHDVVKAIDPSNHLNNLDTAIILAPNS